MKHLNWREPRQFSRATDSTAMRKLKSFYKGIIVTVHQGKRPYKIEEIIPNAGNYEFMKGDHMMTVKASEAPCMRAAVADCDASVQDYFQQHHNVTLKWPEAFGVRTSKTAVFPAEMCTIFPGQVYKKKLDGQDTTELLRMSTAPPRTRISNIQRAVSQNVSFSCFVGSARRFERSALMQRLGSTSTMRTRLTC